jgi:hypothetical protein
MKKPLVALLFWFPAVMVAQSQSSREPVIDDVAERQAYLSAISIPDSQPKGQALEAFVRQYPHSVKLMDALEQATSAYMAAGNAGKVQEMVVTTLAFDPNNARALTMACAMDRSQASKNNLPALRAAAQHCARGLKVLPALPKREGMMEFDFKKLRDQMSAICNGGSGFVALHHKQWTAARSFYLNALRVDPDDISNNYEISIADLAMDPVDPDGLW